MFGSLFEENGEADARKVNVFTLTRKVNTMMAEGGSGEITAAPPPERCKLTRLCGIENQGATCYLNSLLQTLLFTPEFRDSLFKLGPEVLGNLEDIDKPQSKVRVIPIQLQRLFAGLLLLDQQVVSTVDLTTSFGWTNNEEVQQHDAQELIRILFSAIENSLVGTAGKSLISDLYHGTLVNQIICDVCGRISEREEDFLDLTVAVAKKKTLEKSLHDAFVEMEVMNERNQYACEFCGSYVDAKKGAKIRKLPPILTLSLLRFSYDFDKGGRCKETCKFTFPLELDMGPYYEQNSLEENTKYDLYSVVIHKGSGYGGHYHAYIKDIDHLGTWNYTEEEKENAEPVAPTQQHTHRDKRQKTVSENSEVYQPSKYEPKDIIVNVLLTKPDFQTTLDILCREIMTATGSSWNNKFKKSHGPISRFLDHHNALFFYDMGSGVVMLIDGYTYQQSLLGLDTSGGKQEDATAHPPPALPNEHPAPALNGHTNGHVNGRADQVVDMEIDPHGDRHEHNLGVKKAEPNLDAWFDINDGTIKPISPMQIERQFAGKESAYMLFYRKVSLHRPLEAINNPEYCVPRTLQDEIRSQNETFSREREEHEKNVNTIQIQLLFGKNHHVVNGTIQPVPDTLSQLDMTLDRRKPLSEFHEDIAALGVHDLICDEYNLSIAGEFPAGLHLYSDLNKEEHSKSLLELGVQNGSNIFLWNGKEVAGIEVLVGPLHEPVALQISVFTKDEKPLEVFSGFPHSLTMSELYLAVAELLKLNADGLRLMQVICDDNSSLEMKDKPDDASLQEIGILDGFHVYFDYRANPSPRPPARCLICITVENRCKPLEQDQKSWPSKIVEVDKDATISELKSLALFKLSLAEDQYFIQSVHNCVELNPPMHDHLTLTEAKLTNGCRVVITEGKKLSENDLMLTVQLPPSRAKEEIQIVWDQTKTLGELVGYVVRDRGLEVGNSWHLCRTNWCREVTEVIENMEAAVRELQINHGDHLVLETGGVCSNTVKFMAWLYPTPRPSPRHADQSLNIIRLALQQFWPHGNADPIRINIVETEPETSLDMVKENLMTIINLNLVPNNLLPPTVTSAHLRLRLFEGQRPARVLRGRNEQIRKQKMSNQSDLCIQVLDHEEDLSQNSLVVLVVERSPEPGVYHLPTELVVDVGELTEIQTLAALIAEDLGLDASRLLLAKHIPDRFEWMLLHDEPPQHSDSTVRKKKNPKKNLLKNSPYFFKDGDVIGVIDKSKVMDEDFSTKEDLAGKQKQREEAETKKLERLAKGQTQNGPLEEGEPKKTERKPEVGIKIFVGDFS